MKAVSESPVELPHSTKHEDLPKLRVVTKVRAANFRDPQVYDPVLKLFEFKPEMIEAARVFKDKRSIAGLEDFAEVSAAEIPEMGVEATPAVLR